MGPLATTLMRLFGARGWMLLSGFAALALVVIPLLRTLPPDHALYLSDYFVLLIGKIMCYAMVALAMDLVWGYAGILSLGHGLFFALGGYAMGMTLMREIGTEGQYQSNLPDYMVFLDWKE
ncbi:MAG: urea transporter, permease protein UrtC, partial [Proteobacteria bacterium]|nr:urea transporter, permease protein UrtC [Pseudomonadota bacterium]